MTALVSKNTDSYPSQASTCVPLYVHIRTKYSDTFPWWSLIKDYTKIDEVLRCTVTS